MSVKATCPGCNAVLSITRPDEPRVAPCPRCQFQIRIPEHLQSAGLPSAQSQDSVEARTAHAVVPAAQSRTSSTPILLGIGVLIAGAFAFAQSDLADANQSATPARQSEAFDKEVILDELAEFEATEHKLQTQVTDLEKKLELARSQLEKQLNISRNEIETIKATLTGESK